MYKDPTYSRNTPRQLLYAHNRTRSYLMKVTCFTSYFVFHTTKKCKWLSPHSCVRVGSSKNALEDSKVGWKYTTARAFGVFFIFMNTYTVNYYVLYVVSVEKESVANKRKTVYTYT